MIGASCYFPEITGEVRALSGRSIRAVTNDSGEVAIRLTRTIAFPEADGELRQISFEGSLRRLLDQVESLAVTRGLLERNAGELRLSRC